MKNFKQEANQIKPTKLRFICKNIIRCYFDELILKNFYRLYCTFANYLCNRILFLKLLFNLFKIKT